MNEARDSAKLIVDTNRSGGTMRVLWLSPGLRPLARMYAEGLMALGADVRLVTANIHPESDNARDYETVLVGRPIPTKDWLPILDTYRSARKFCPDVVVTEFLRDPRWKILASLAPRIRLLHDDVPHDRTHLAPWWNRMFFDRWDLAADATIVFSDYVAESLRRRMYVASDRLYTVPLTSDLPSASAPDFVPADRRKNVVLFGRQRPYKNHRVVFEAWTAHMAGGCWPGDELVLVGDGEIECPLPKHVRWHRKPFKYRDTVELIATARASLIHYRQASQSGVQVLSLQLGIPTLVSTAGALPEYQPDGLSPVAIDDAAGLARALDKLSRPADIERHAKQAREHYEAYFRPTIAASSLMGVFDDIRRKHS